MTQQNNDFSEEHNRLIQEARKQLERQKYQEAIDHLDYIINNSDRDGYAFFLRGKAYSQLKEYKPALFDFETALEIYRETDNKKYQVYTLIELAFVYPFNGKVREGFLAQQQTFKISKELDLSEDDPLYSYVSDASKMSDDSLEKMESSLQSMTSIPPWDKFGFMGRMMGYVSKGEIQSYLVFTIWLPFIILVLVGAIIFSPFWLPQTIYQIWKRRKNTE
ncbi:hypothetical protein [Myxosarcina sp. GI1]|uniref:hypothetical protein n=1 Tax=Myxosarcina sp. GI1 TaxID=1541065 RepID=UPI000563AEA4|nr:hypothetical protein [Myxosarcina sp. GI1]